MQIDDLVKEAEVIALSNIMEWRQNNQKGSTKLFRQSINLSVLFANSLYKLWQPIQ